MGLGRHLLHGLTVYIFKEKVGERASYWQQYKNAAVQDGGSTRRRQYKSPSMALK
jgi:hypothetical protein